MAGPRTPLPLPVTGSREPLRRHPVVRGVRHTTGPVTVRAETIAEFARTVRHPRSRVDTGGSGAVAPVSFAATVLTPALGAVLAEVLPDPAAARLLHLDQVVEIRRQAIEGDRLLCRTAVDSYRHFADYHVLAIRSALVDRRGAVTLSATTSLLTRIGGDRPSLDRGDATFLETDEPDIPTEDAVVPLARLRIGTVLAPWSTALTRADLLRYAALTGAGSMAPSTIETALAVSYLDRRLGPGATPLRLRTQTSRHLHHLTVPVPDSATVVFGGRITGLDAARERATVAVTARCGGRDLFSHASIDLRLPR
ncbi:FAS1-like dehydratase domain-containing protein [Nocardia takedensis]